MKKFLSMLLAMVVAVGCLFAFTGCSKDDGNGDKTLYVYTNAGFAPYEYIDANGNVVGVDMDIMKEVGDVLGYEVVINDIEFNQILDEVGKNKNAVGAAGMTKKKDRDDVALASISYATSVQYVIVPKNTFGSADLVDGKLPVSKLAELSNKTVGVQLGTTGNYLVDDAIAGTTDDEGNHVTGDLEGSGATTVTYSNAIIASQDIGTTLGAVVIDKLPAQSICGSNSNLECFQLDAEPESYVLYFNKEATTLVAEVNKVLQVMIDNGVIDYYTIKHSGGIL